MGTQLSTQTDKLTRRLVFTKLRNNGSGFNHALLCRSSFLVSGVKLLTLLLLIAFYVALFPALEQTHWPLHVLVHAGLF